MLRPYGNHSLTQTPFTNGAYIDPPYQTGSSSIVSPYSPGVTFGPVSSDHRLNPPYMNVTECNTNEYLKLLPESMKASVEKLSAATFPILNSNNALIGSCVAIAPDLLLTSKHCVANGTALVGVNKVKVGVVFDGYQDDLDFKILQVVSGGLTPIILSASVDAGRSVQMSFKAIDCLNPVTQYVKPYTSDNGVLASRSNTGSLTTRNTESGSPRMSLETGAVHAVHQGSGEGLKMCDVYDAIRKAATNSYDYRNANAKYILSKIKILNLDMALMDWSPLSLNIGDVCEEKGGGKARIKGTITHIVTYLEKTPSGRGKNVNKEEKFDYKELGEGKDDRGISIEKRDVANSLSTYAIYPDPHDNNRYNKGGQEDFYKKLANDLADQYLNNRAFPANISVKVLNEKYQLNR